MAPSLRLLAAGTAAVLFLTSPVSADGTGLIGFGKTMYNPTCAFACRNVIRSSPLACTPTEDDAELHGSGHSMFTTPPSCYVSDPAFLHTMALCIYTHCPHGAGGMPSLSLLEDYWAGHLGTGTVGTDAYTPAMSYAQALREVREETDSEVHLPSSNSTTDPSAGHDDHSAHSDHSRLKVRHHGDHAEGEDHEHAEQDAIVTDGLPVYVRGEPLNTTSVVEMDAWQIQYNGMTAFEINETGHSTYTITVMLVALFLPVLLSLFRFIPFLRSSSSWVWLNSMLISPPVWGSSHRAPVAPYLGGGMVPTRGQALYIGFLSLLNIIFLTAPFYNILPQSSYPTLEQQEIALTGNRAGNLALGNMVAMFVFSSRNNILLYLTDWSHGTFLLLHRWLGYWVIFHTILHSIMLLVYYVMFGDYEAELARLYWVWGIVGTVAAAAIWPASLLVVRQRFYQVFLATHQALVLVFLIGFYYHIWFCFRWNWGYEIWMFIASGIWAFDYVLRIVRIVFKGRRTAVVSAVEGSNGEYMRITVDGVTANGVVYLCFPTLSWKFWETHPLSVASSFAYDTASASPSFDKQAYPEPAKTASDDVIERAEDKASGTSSPAPAPKVVVTYGNARPQATFLVRTRAGVTRTLADRLAKSSGSIRLPVLLEGSYHSAPLAQLSGCTSILCIAGGVGITTVLPVLQASGLRPAKLYWGMRDASLLHEISDLMDALPSTVQTKTSVGAHLDIPAILNDELLSVDEKAGPVGIVVSGPPGMADQVRVVVSSIGQTGTARQFVLVDEGFSW